MTDLTTHIPQSLVRWVFQRGAEILTCRVDCEANGSKYTMSVIPHAHVELTAAETFPTGVRALQQHAYVAAQLRQHGWTVIGYSDAAPATQIAA